MSQIKEVRRLDTSDLRSLCIRHNWYTCGDNDEYSHMFLLAHKDNITTNDIIAISKDIMAHSEMKSEYQLTDVCYEVAETCYTFFTEE